MRWKFSRKWAALWVALSLSVGGLTACAAAEEKVTATGFFFDTVVTITLNNTSQSTVDNILQICGEYEELLSKTVEGSDVWRINHSEGQPVTVSQHTLNILDVASKFSGLSEGAFDVTVAPIVELWDFTGNTAVLPDAQEIKDRLALVGYQMIQVNGDMVTLPAGMAVDFGGVAKGYIADRIAEYCRESGVKSGILNFGGNVVVLGEKPDGEPWKVGIQDPRSNTGTSIAAVSVRGKSVVTSGIYERGFTLDGVRYHHLLDPDTGWPAQNELASVTIISDSSADGDALSTSCFVLGLEKGMALIDSLDGIEAIFIDRDNKITTSSGFENDLQLTVF